MLKCTLNSMGGRITMIWWQWLKTRIWIFCLESCNPGKSDHIVFDPGIWWNEDANHEISNPTRVKGGGREDKDELICILTVLTSLLCMDRHVWVRACVRARVCPPSSVSVSVCLSLSLSVTQTGRFCAESARLRKNRTRDDELEDDCNCQERIKTAGQKNTQCWHTTVRDVTRLT